MRSVQGGTAVIRRIRSRRDGCHRSVRTDSGSFAGTIRCLLAARALALCVLPPATLRADSHLEASARFIEALADEASTTLTGPDLAAAERQRRSRELFRDLFALFDVLRRKIERDAAERSRACCGQEAPA